MRVHDRLLAPEPMTTGDQRWDALMPDEGKQIVLDEPGIRAFASSGEFAFAMKVLAGPGFMTGGTSTSLPGGSGCGPSTRR
jgi:hypothetical protein